MVVDHWLSERKLMPKDLRKAYDSLFMLVFLLVWKERNSRVFDRFGTIPAWLLPKINLEAGQWVAAGFRRLMPLFVCWSQTV